MKAIATLLVVATGISALSAAADTTVAPDPDWLGCYELSRGAWDAEPESSLGDLPGARLRLHAGAPPRLQYYGGPPWPTDQPRRRAQLLDHKEHLGSWWLVRSDSLVAVFGQLAGVALYLKGSPQTELTGVAVTFTDIGGGTREKPAPWVTTAPLSARRIACR